MHLDETPLFSPLPADCRAGGTVVLDETELAHLKVFRLDSGDTLDLVDGEGGTARARVENPKRGLLVLESDPVREAVRPAAPSLAIGALKGSDTEEVFDHCAQAALRSFQPLWCDFGQRARGSGAADGLVRRLRAKARVALKQSRQLWATEIREPAALDDWFASVEAAGERVVLLDETGGRAPVLPDSAPIWMLCGPEGGFSARELALLEGKSVPLSLGPSRLRARTAPVFAMGALSALLAKR